jgi:ribosomal protein L11 methyltransferase
MTDSWLTYHCRVREADVAKVEDCFEQASALAISCTEGERDRLVFDLLDDTRPLWSVCEVAGLFDADANLDSLEKLFSNNAVIPLHARVTTLQDRNWHESYREQFQAQKFGNNLWVCPTWVAAPVGAEHVIRIDPGMAFGTGNHATTALCLDWLAGSDAVAGAKVLDYGCGSGILAIAAAKLGAAQVTAVDIDSAVLEVSQDNASLNGLANLIITDPATIGGRRYDVVVANILLEPLVALAPNFAQHLAPGGQIVLSGILRGQITGLLAAYAGEFKMPTQRQLGEWALVAGVLDSP